MDSRGFRLRGTEPFEAAVSSLFGSLRVTDPGPPGFHAVVDHVAIGALMVARIQAAAATVTRDTRCITSTDVEWMHLTLHCRGQVTVTQDERTTALKPGELFACDNTRPYRIIGAEPSDMTVLCVPRASLGKQADCMAGVRHSPYPRKTVSAGFSAAHCPGWRRTSPVKA